MDLKLLSNKLLNDVIDITCTEEPGRLQFMGSQRVGLDWVTALPLPFLSYWGSGPVSPQGAHIMGLSSNVVMRSGPQWFPSLEISITEGQVLLGGLNGTKHDSEILKYSPKTQKGWNASQLVGPGYSLSCKHLLYSFQKHLLWANRAGIDIKVKRGVIHSTHCRLTTVQEFCSSQQPMNYALSVPIITDPQWVTRPRSHK